MSSVRPRMDSITGKFRPQAQGVFDIAALSPMR
jgi:hypothetical protein